VSALGLEPKTLCLKARGSKAIADCYLLTVQSLCNYRRSPYSRFGLIRDVSYSLVPARRLLLILDCPGAQSRTSLRGESAIDISNASRTRETSNEKQEPVSHYQGYKDDQRPYRFHGIRPHRQTEESADPEGRAGSMRSSQRERVSLHARASSISDIDGGWPSLLFCSRNGLA
jgi:hypothetical protein